MWSPAPLRFGLANAPRCTPAQSTALNVMTSDSASLEPTATVTSLDPLMGRLIAGRYELIEKLGEGGMGEVWIAKQSDPVKRKVALKLVKKGMDSKAVLQRFEQERQALAVMDHPTLRKSTTAALLKPASRTSPWSSSAAQRLPSSAMTPEIGFLESPHAAGWAVYSVSTNRFLVTLDGSSLFHSSSRSRGFFGGHQINVSTSGRVAVIDVSRQKAPKVVEVLQSCGGRNSAMLRREGRTYLITAGFVHATTDKDHQLHECCKFFPHASTLDEASYQGDADGDHTALVGDRTVTVLRMAKK
jgi:hypothetical protein